jgi:hypothetical protein
MSMVFKKCMTAIAGAALVAAFGGIATTALPSCSQTPTNVPVQTFEQPKAMDVICMQVLDPTETYEIIPPVPVPQSYCAQVPVNVVGSSLPYHLFALVTQTTRGEVAVVDLTGGNVVDVNPDIPGINFLPVGKLPSDISATADGRMVFVGSADPNAPAIYALPSVIVLGDAQTATGVPAPLPGTHAQTVIPDLTTWPVCSLPQVPGAVRVLPNDVLPALPDGTQPPSSSAGYVLVATLPGDSANPAGIVIVDPAPLLRGAAPYLGDAGEGPGDVDPPAALKPCTILQHITLGTLPASTTWLQGPAWDDGVGYGDGGASVDLPQTWATACVGTDAGLAGTPGAHSPLFPLPGQGSTPFAGSAALDLQGPKPLLYVADSALPLIHVIDVSNPEAIVELPPLMATSIASPDRAVSVGQIAISPTTRDYKRFLYAIDRTGGSLMVYDITDPATTNRVPLTRPHPALDPFQPPDRIIFSAPVASVAFVQHDWPLQEKIDLSAPGQTISLLTAETGLECNPNPHVDTNPGNTAVAVEQGPFATGPIGDGAYYRFSETFQEVPLGPYRLRGVFAFATLSSGNIVTIDVDDWDAPCRRPDPLGPRGSISGSNDILLDGQFSAIAPPQTSTGPGDLAPLDTPVAYESAYTDPPTSIEWFYPVSAPHRVRSEYLLRNDPVNGDHAPYLIGVPQLFASGAPVATQGSAATASPLLVPTAEMYLDPSIFSNPTEGDPTGRTPTFTPSATPLHTSPDGGVTSDPLLVQSDPSAAVPAVRFQWEDPQVQQDQDWAVTYEGTLPGFWDANGNPLVMADVITTDNYSSLELTDSSAYFCSKGVEDFTIGQARAQAALAAMSSASLNAVQPDGGVPSSPIAGYDQQVADYVQLTDQIRDPTDPYWQVPNACWDALGSDYAPTNASTATNRVNLCNSTYGNILDPTNPSPQRDFPIVHARDGSLQIGRFAYTNGTPGARQPGGPWVVVGPDPSNAPFLSLMQCCFHEQVSFNLRTGGEWSAVGSANGFLHHIIGTGSDGTCAPSCDERDALLNGRAPPVPRPPATKSGQIDCQPGFVPSIDRDNPLAMRNPQFSFFIWNGQSSTQGCSDLPPSRDMQWTFSTRGDFVPLSLNLAATTTGLSPQSMFFIDSLGQLAVIDGSSQGLILIDLDTITEAHTPYY